MLAVVQHEQQPARAQGVLQRFQERAAGFFAYAERRGGRLRHERGIGQRRQCGNAHAISKHVPAVQVARHLKREPGLTYAAGTGQRQQPRPGEQALHLFQLPRPADEAAHGDRHGLPGPVRRCGRKGVREA